MLKAFYYCIRHSCLRTRRTFSSFYRFRIEELAVCLLFFCVCFFVFLLLTFQDEAIKPDDDESTDERIVSHRDLPIRKEGKKTYQNLHLRRFKVFLCYYFSIQTSQISIPIRMLQVLFSTVNISFFSTNILFFLFCLQHVNCSDFLGRMFLCFSKHSDVFCIGINAVERRSLETMNKRTGKLLFFLIMLKEIRIHYFKFRFT